MKRFVRAAAPIGTQGGRDAPLSRLERRPERAEDAAFRFALFRESHGAIFAGLDEALRDTILRQQILAQDTGYRAAHPDGRFDIVVRDDAPVGRIVTALEAEALLLVDLAVAVAARRQGIATHLLRDMLAEARTAGRPVRLRVAPGNVGARQLYESLGFVVVAAGEIEVTMEAVPAVSTGMSANDH